MEYLIGGLFIHPSTTAHPILPIPSSTAEFTISFPVDALRGKAATPCSSCVSFPWWSLPYTLSSNNSFQVFLILTSLRPMSKFHSQMCGWGSDYYYAVLLRFKPSLCSDSLLFSPLQSLLFLPLLFEAPSHPFCHLSLLRNRSTCAFQLLQSPIR